MSNSSNGENLSESSDSESDHANSPKFGDNKDSHVAKIPVSLMQDLRSSNLENDDFDIAEGDDKWDNEDKHNKMASKTFYKPEKPNLISRSNSNVTAENDASHTPNQKVNKEISMDKKKDVKARIFNRKSDPNARHGTEKEEELNFMLSHSNTLLTSEMPEEQKHQKANIIDIDEDSNEGSQETIDHLYAIEKKIEQIQDKLEDETIQRKAEVDQINEKLDKMLSLMLAAKNEPDFTQYRTNTFANMSIPKPAHQKSSNDDECQPQAKLNMVSERKEFEDSEAFFKDMIGSKMESADSNAAKRDNVDNEVKPFVPVEDEPKENNDEPHVDKSESESESDDEDSNSSEVQETSEDENEDEDEVEKEDDKISQDSKQEKKLPTPEKKASISEQEGLTSHKETTPTKVIISKKEITPVKELIPQKELTPKKDSIAKVPKNEDFRRSTEQVIQIPIKVKEASPSRNETIGPENITLNIEEGKSETASETSSKQGISESKIYHSEDDFMKSFLEEIKEESSNITSNETPKPTNPKMDDQEMVQTLKSSQKKMKVKKQKKKPTEEADPMDFLADDFDVVEQTVDKLSSVADDSGFQDTIIGSQYIQKMNPNFSNGKENKVPKLKLKSPSQKFTNHKEIIDVSESEDLIDMLLSEEGEIHEESIIQISENSINKRKPVKIKKDKLVKVNPVERYNEMLKNSQRSNAKDSNDGRKDKSKLTDYMSKNDEEESVKLDDLVAPSKHRNGRAKQNTDRKPRPKEFKNIFFDVHSDRNDPDGDEPAFSNMDDDSIDHSIQSQN